MGEKAEGLERIEERENYKEVSERGFEAGFGKEKESERGERERKRVRERESERERERI